VAAGSSLVEPAAVADITFDLSMCFLCFFFNLPMVGQPPTSGRFFFKFFHMRFAQRIKKKEKKGNEKKENC
jgi:hypothetical protein